ncbi:MarR family winged helix-turn-helix transcriptional regulator [Paenibacillus zanthoxyli]|uniref:MarR family winged helix-turn-helix transcriptional regulator n=1 Tax=Paenibacillus zanthoxyli TaxID=369399 RepID=UPI00047133BA|nr:MarR family transcriptional regulator [Paenibacillus zanthoxyli]
MSKQHTFQYQFRTIGHKLKMLGDKKLESYDLTLEQAHLIDYLYHHEEKGISQKDIERVFQRKGSTVSSIVVNLEKKGFLERKVGATDERKKILSLLPKGKEVVRDFEAFFEELEEVMTSRLSRAEIEKLSRTLSIVIANLDEHI